jgi:thiol:disulfide interchange protein DsbC
MTTIDFRRLAAAIALPCLLTLSCPSFATPTKTETKLLGALRNAHPGTNFTQVSATPIPGVYEVWMSSNVAYASDKNLRYLVFGHLFDTQSMVDLTSPKLAKIEREHGKSNDGDAPSITMPFDQFPLGDAIKTVHGDGNAQHLIVFSDPGCPYCKRLEPELDKLQNVTIHTFLLPFQGVLAPTAIWCAPDRALAWYRAMHEDNQKAQSDHLSDTTCGTPLERNLALAKRLAIQGTPTIFYANGRRTDGFADVAEIEAQMSAPIVSTAEQGESAK